MGGAGQGGSLTHLDLLALGGGLVARALPLLARQRRVAADLALRHAQVQQQRADLDLELQAARMLQNRHQVQLQVLPHAAHLGLGQGGGQVGCGGVIIK